MSAIAGVIQGYKFSTRVSISRPICGGEEYGVAAGASRESYAHSTPAQDYWEGL